MAPALDDFTSIDTKWHENANKRFASPFMGTKHDRISVDPMMLSHAAVACGYSISDFYASPELGSRCVAAASEMYDLLPVTHWYFSLPWVAELGIKIRFMDQLPPVSEGPIITDPSLVDSIEVPDTAEIEKGWTAQQIFRGHDYVQEHLPKMFLPMTYTSDLTGSAAQLCGIENFVMWTLAEPDAAHKLVRKYTDTAVNGAEVIANRYGMAMIATGSVLGNNDIFSDTDVDAFSARYLNDFVMSSLRKGAGPQVFYHLCGNHETDYKIFKERIVYSPFSIVHIGYMGRDVFPSDLLVKEFGGMATVMGSVDTRIMTLPNAQKVYEQARDQIIKGRDAPNGYILGTACEVPPYAPPVNVHALTKAAKDFGTYGTW
ncbi:MAG: uroporphyrinogen decarboxylase family protein [Methanomassiliicoccales archaeon]